jgi:hypothetical protein
MKIQILLLLTFTSNQTLFYFAIFSYSTITLFISTCGESIMLAEKDALGVASCAIEEFDEKTKEQHSPMIKF